MRKTDARVTVSMKQVYYNQQSGGKIFCDKGKFYLFDAVGNYESDSLQELVDFEKSLDPRMGWN